MNSYDFEKIDRELDRELRNSNNVFDWNPRMIDEEPPPKFEWLPVGEYDGIDLPNTIVDKDYIVWLKIKCQEYNCEVVQ